MLSIKNLSIFHKSLPLLNNISFSLKKGEMLGIIGESGSGKSLLAKSILRLNDEEDFSYKGEIDFAGKNILTLKEKELLQIRGKDIGMIFQDPFISLNPVHTIEKQIIESLLVHNLADKKQSYLHYKKIMKEVGLQEFVGKKIYPHQLSGGQKQRVVIAIFIINKPKLIIADEATTALDPSISQEIIKLLLHLQKKYNISLIFISHDLSLVKSIVDKVIILKEGELVEQGCLKEIWQNPKTAYSKRLIAATEHDFSLNDKLGREILNLNKLTLAYENSTILKKESKEIIKEFSLTIKKGETVGLVGESGSGKTTITRAILGFLKPKTGDMLFQNLNIYNLKKENLRLLRKDFQIVFQDPFSSLNPKKTIFAILKESLDAFKIKEQKNLIENIIKEVGLETEMLNRKPIAFSGGQRQRIAIARSLITSPKLIILDEPTASLDTTSQKNIIKLLITLQKKYQLSYLFISHDKSLTESFCHKIKEI